MTLRHILPEFTPLTPETSRPAYVEAVRAKIERDRETYREFRAIDQDIYERQHERMLASEVDAWEADVRLFRQTVRELEAEAAKAGERVKAAEDKLAEATKYAEQCQAAYELAKDSGASPEEITEADLRFDKALRVAQDAARPVEALRQAAAEAEEDAANEREGLANARNALGAAKANAKKPAEEAPISDITILVCASYMQQDEIWNTLPAAYRSKVADAMVRRPLVSRDEMALHAARALM